MREATMARRPLHFYRFEFTNDSDWVYTIVARTRVAAERKLLAELEELGHRAVEKAVERAGGLREITRVTSWLYPTIGREEHGDVDPDLRKRRKARARHQRGGSRP